MRIYRPPTFNIACRIWLDAFPPSLRLWDGNPPARPADIVAPCQLYLPRGGYGRGFHANSDNALSTFTESGFQELRLPKDTGLRTVWGVSEQADFSKAPLIEVPSGSGRLYLCVLAEDKHKGFPNEYRIGILAQLSRHVFGGRLAVGAGATAAIPFDFGVSALSMGVKAVSQVTPPAGQEIVTPPDYLPSIVLPWTVRPDLAAGGAGETELAALPGESILAAGAAVKAKLAALPGESILAAGAAVAAVVTIPAVPSDLAAGVAMTSTYLLILGGAVGGTSCAAATTVPVNSGSLVIVVAGTPKWLRCPIPAGTYKVTVAKLSGLHVDVFAKFGACPGPASWGALNTGGTLCVSSALGAGDLFVTVNPPASSSSQVSVRIETGTC